MRLTKGICLYQFTMSECNAHFYAYFVETNLCINKTNIYNKKKKSRGKKNVKKLSNEKKTKSGLQSQFIIFPWHGRSYGRGCVQVL